MDRRVSPEQAAVCARFGTPPEPVSPGQKLGIARDLSGLPVNGLRHRPSKTTSGWYIWTGETLSDADDFFRPLHVAHATESLPAVTRYLALPPGWRFLLAPDYEDVWFDETLLDSIG